MVTDEGCLAIIIRNTGAAPATTLVIDRLKLTSTKHHYNIKTSL